MQLRWLAGLKRNVRQRYGNAALRAKIGEKAVLLVFASPSVKRSVLPSQGGVLNAKPDQQDDADEQDQIDQRADFGNRTSGFERP